MSELSNNCYNVSQIRQLEQLAETQLGISDSVLMERAGLAAFKTLHTSFPNAKKIAVLCGRGHNGGDGYVLARQAHEEDFTVTIFYLGSPSDLPKAAREAYLSCQKLGLEILPFSAATSLNHFDLIVDALLGIGISREINGELKNAIDLINNSNKDVLAIDVPSGLDADTGCIRGVAVNATLTATFIALKPGLLTHQGLTYCGHLICDNLDLPAAIFQHQTPAAIRLSWNDLPQILPRPRHAHKGNYGHVLVIGGDYGMPGAARLAAEAAARIGSGLVTVATRSQHIAAIVATRPELLCYGIDEMQQLDALIQRATVIIIGPGLGNSSWSTQCWNKVVNTEKTLIVDASALHLLAENPVKNDKWILTPHPGEAAQLLGISAKEVQQDRFAAVNKLQQQYGGIIVLKGAGTIIKTQQKSPTICISGNPGMATAGMGDVLSGVIGGLIAQHLTPAAATNLAVYLHATAGDNAAKHGARGLLASDLFELLYKLVNKLS